MTELRECKKVEASRSFYAGNLNESVATILEEAMGSYADTGTAERLLQKALSEAPTALPVYFSMYKFYFYKGQLEAAEKIVRIALKTAAEQGEFPEDWHDLSASTLDWNLHDTPAHFYLFTLKALAFIRLRRGDQQECESILQKIRELDRSDSVGASVISAMSAGL